MSVVRTDTPPSLFNEEMKMNKAVILLITAVVIIIELTLAIGAIWLVWWLFTDGFHQIGEFLIRLKQA